MRRQLLDFLDFIITKSFTRNSIPFSNNALKLTYSKAAFQKFSVGVIPDPPLGPRGGESLMRVGRGGEGREGEGRV